MAPTTLAFSTPTSARRTLTATIQPRCAPAGHDAAFARVHSSRRMRRRKVERAPRAVPLAPASAGALLGNSGSRAPPVPPETGSIRSRAPLIPPETPRSSEKLVRAAEAISGGQR